MPAIITDTLKRKIARDFFDGFSAGTQNYYVGISKSEQWDSFENVPTPVNNPETAKDFRDGLQAIKKMQGASLVVPRNNWSNGRIYSPYDDTQQGYPTNPYYVKTDNNQIYVCLETGRNSVGVAQPSTVEPTGSNTGSFRTADGYVWKFLYTISAAEAEKFQSSNFIPVKKQGATDSNSTGIELKHAEIQNTAQAGEVLSIVVTGGGTGYTSVPTVTITGNGSGASATASIDSNTGQVARIQMDPDSSTLKHGNGYTSAVVTISGGGGVGATARAIIPFSDSGVGADARIDLKTSSVMFHTMLEGSDSDFLVGQDFRQVGLMQNPLHKGTGSQFTAVTGNALTKMRVSNIVTNFTRDKIIEGQNSLAKAYVDHIDSNEVYYHQTSETGFTAFINGEPLQEINGAGAGTIDSAAIDPVVDRASGDLLYIDNRGPVSRTTSQAEDIKIIIQF